MTLDNIKYMTFSQLMSSVESDMESFADSGMVDRSKYIKTIRKVNSDLGVRINQEKEVLLDIKNYRTTLPDDFEHLQLALLCEETPTRCQIVSPSPDAPKLISCLDTDSETFNPCASCPTSCPEGSSTTICGQCYKVYQKVDYDLTLAYSTKVPVKLTKRSHAYCSSNCLNSMLNSDKYKYTLDIDDRVITLSGVKEGKVYINYITDMVNEDNEILLVNHPLLTDYYEYSVKEKMLENYMLNNDSDVSSKLKYIIEQKKLARIDAMNFVYMPEFTEITAYQKAKRENFYNRFFKQFERY